MRSETISIHGGFDHDPATKAVAPPIYQNVAYEFDSADHGAALFNLEVEGFRYSRIANPTTDILEKRVAQLEGGVARARGRLRPGRPRLRFSHPRRSRRQYRRAAHALWHDAHAARPRLASQRRRGAFRQKRARRGHRAPDRRGDARGVLRIDRQSGRQHLRHRGDRQGRARARRAADRRQHRRDADSHAPDRARRRHRRAFLDQVHGRPRRRDGRRHRRQRRF